VKPKQAFAFAIGAGKGFTEALFTLGNRLATRPALRSPARRSLNHGRHAGDFGGAAPAASS